MRILLVDILRTSLEEVWPSAEHSLGLMYLAAAVRREFGDGVDVAIWTLISSSRQPDQERTELLKQMEEFRPDIVGIRSLSIGQDAYHRAARTVKERDPECLVVAGGPYGTDDPGGVLCDGYTDCVVIGEGEVTFNELVRCVKNGLPWQAIAGIVHRPNGTIVRTEPRAMIQDLESLPMPDYSLIDLERFSNRYLTFTSKISKPHANIMTTRGCPYRCAYCHNILGKTFRVRSPEHVMREIRMIHDTYGITDFQVIDDIFNLDMDRAKKICDLIVRSRLPLTLSFPNAIRSDRVDEELIDKMAAAGTKFISIAIETASPRLQRLIRKNLDLDRAYKAIDTITRVGIVTRGFFMIGFPTETEDEARQTIEYAKASSLCGATFFTVVYFPGTDLYRIARSLGYFTDQPFNVQRDYVNVGEGPYEFDLATLTELKKKAIREFAFTRERLDQVLRLLPGYFTQREIDGFLMAYVVSSRAALDDIDDPYVRQILKRYFAVANTFSKKNEFYV